MRICKVIGYGLTDVSSSRMMLDDGRINPGSPLLKGEGTFDDYREFLEGLRRAKDDPLATWDVSLEIDSIAGMEGSIRAIFWNSEYGNPQILVAQPASRADWSRYDDPIDYVEETSNGGIGDPRWFHPVGNFHPFDGLNMDVRTGELIPGSTGINVWNRARHGRSMPEALLDRLAQRVGYDSHADAEKHVVPLVPQEVRWLCEWGELFTDPKVCLQLRPICYTYWG